MYLYRLSLFVFAAAFASLLGLVTSNISAQELGDLSSSTAKGASTDATDISAPSQPFLRVKTIGQGTCDGENSPCPDTPCVVGHVCGCVSFSNLPINLPLPIGPSPFTLNTEITLDFTLATTTGVGACFAAYGVGTATRVSTGATVGLNFNGQYCSGANNTSSVGGSWHVNGGTGAFPHASGAGDFTEGVSALVGAQPCVLTLDGAFRKAP